MSQLFADIEGHMTEAHRASAEQAQAVQSSRVQFNALQEQLHAMVSDLRTSVDSRVTALESAMEAHQAATFKRLHDQHQVFVRDF